MADIPVSKNEKLGLHRVFAGTAFTVRMTDASGKAKIVMDSLFAFNEKDALEQAREAFPGVDVERFILSEIPDSSVARKNGDRQSPRPDLAPIDQQPPVYDLSEDSACSMNR